MEHIVTTECPECNKRHVLQVQKAGHWIYMCATCRSNLILLPTFSSEWYVNGEGKKVEGKKNDWNR